MQNKTFIGSALSRLSLFSAFCLLWLTLPGIGTPPATTDMNSWRQAFGYAFSQGWHAGVDYVYTWGPLGYFFHPRADYASDLFSGFISFQAIFSGLTALVLTRYAQQCLVSGVQKLLYFALLILIVATFPPNAIQFVTVIAAILLLYTSAAAFAPQQVRRKPYNVTLSIENGGLLMVLALMALAKFTTFVLIVVGIINLTVFCLLRRDWLAASLIPACFTVIFLLLWLGVQGSVSHLPSFLYYSLLVSQGYGEAMSSIGDSLQLVIAGIILSLTSVLLVAGLFIPQFHQLTDKTGWASQLPHVPLTLFLAFAMFLAWKAGFIRQDTGHEIIFFTFMLILPFFIAPNSRSRFVTALRCAIIFIALIGLFISTHPRYSADKVLNRWWQQVHRNIAAYGDLSGLKQQREQQLATLRQQHDLPQIRQHIGNAPVDILSWEQGVLLLNQFNWQPRPVFQSYVAYTPTLAALNQHFFTGPTAPEFVIFKLQTIDGRLPSLDDAPVLNHLLRHYRPVLAERGYLLLARATATVQTTSAATTLTTPPLLSTSLRWGEWQTLTAYQHAPFSVQLQIEKSFLGKLTAFLFRIPPVLIELKTTEAVIHRYRLIPAMTRTEVLLNPLILTQADVQTWYTAPDTLPTPAQLRIVTTSALAESFYQPDITLHLKGFIRHVAENAAENLPRPRE